MQLHRVIVVDDELYTRKGLIKIIDWEACGFQIIDEADNGEDALELIMNTCPDLVITDIRMPVLDGLELIRRVTEHASVSPMFIIVSGYDDFSYAQQAVRYGVHDYILKPIDEHEFMKTLCNLNEKFNKERLARSRQEMLLTGVMIESLIMGEVDTIAVAEWEERLKLKQSSQLFYMFVEWNDYYTTQPNPQETMNDSFKERVQRALRQVTAETDQPLYMHEHRNRVGILVPDAILHLFHGDIATFAKSLQETLMMELAGRVFIYIGEPVTELLNISESYETAKESLLYKFVYDSKGIIIYEEAKTINLQYIGLDQSVYTLLIEQIEELELEKLQKTIDMLFHSFTDLRCVPEAVKMNMNHCVQGVIKVIQEMDGVEGKLATFEPLTEWHDLNLSLKELKRLFTAFAMESGTYISVLRKDQQKGGIHKIHAYIESNFRDNISLKSIAGLFYINPVYLGQLFKKTYGMYFNDFLLHLRVNEAKKLLRQTDMRIYEVAERVGFGNPDYFVTQFEKIEQMAPSEYRNRLVKEAASERMDT